MHPDESSDTPLGHCNLHPTIGTHKQTEYVTRVISPIGLSRIPFIDVFDRFIFVLDIKNVFCFGDAKQDLIEALTAWGAKFQRHVCGFNHT